jgi:N-acetylglutamate synthase-like GNAT family acetyltransferase
MTAGLTVRFATLDDLHFVSQDQYIPVDIVKRKIEWQEVIIAEINGDPVGYLRIEYLWSAMPYIALVRVLAEHRGKGVGKTMLRYTEDHLREKGHEELYSSSQVNEAEAQRWHRGEGFEECGMIAGINEGGIGEVIFRKRLKEIQQGAGDV